MPSLASKIHELWNATVSAISAQRVFTGHAPPGTVAPYVSMLVAGSDLPEESNTSAFDSFSLGFRVYSENYDTGLAIAEDIFESWNGQAFQIDSTRYCLNIQQLNLVFTSEATGMWRFDVDLEATIQTTGCAADSSSSSGITASSSSGITESSSSGISESSSSSSGASYLFEGFGRATTGGTDGNIVYVTNLNASGAGSLIQALSDLDGTPTIIKFSVCGNIDIGAPQISSKSNFTIDGSDAPTGGICLKGSLRFSTCTNFILRHLRIRTDHVDTGQGPDSLQLLDCDTFVLEYLSLSWATDENLDVTRCQNGTIQYCMISEGLTVPSRALNAFSQNQGETYGLSWYRNLFAHGEQRNPNMLAGDHDFVNNVVYNWGQYATMISSDATYGAQVNWNGNYYRSGLSNDNADVNKALYTFGGGQPTAYWSNDNYSYDAGGAATGSSVTPEATRFDFPEFSNVGSATAILADVLANAGATLPKRDAVDTRVAADVTAGTGTVIAHPTDVGGWPNLCAMSSSSGA